MRYRIYGQKRHFPVAATIKVFSLTFFFGTLIFCGFYIGSSMISYLTSNLNTIPSTSTTGTK